MGLNTYPYNPFPASTDKLDEAHNEQIQEEVEQLSNEITDLDNELNNLDNKIYGDAVTYPYADVITIDNAVPANLAGCIVKIEPVQSGSGVPSPENVRPITGHTEASVEVTDGDETTNTYTISLGDTIYGGTVDFDSGVMTSSWKSVNLGSYDWGKVNNEFFCAEITDFKQGPLESGVRYGNIICSDYDGTDHSVIRLYFEEWRSFYRLFITDPTKADMTESEFKAAMDGVQLCYELATPTTIQLTPQQIQLLKGTNTLTASTGDISVTVNGVSGSIGAVQTQANATDEALKELVADIAEKLPTAPTTDGAYVLTVTVASGTPTYSWESAE